MADTKQLHATQDVRNLYYAIATVASDNTVTYSAPVRIMDLQTASLNINVSSDKKYADGNAVDIISAFEDGTLSISTYGIALSVLAVLEGNTIDPNGVVIKNADDEAPYVAIGWEAPKRNKKSRFTWLPFCKKKIDKEEYKTKEKKPDPQSSALTFDVERRSDGVWNYSVDEADAVAAGFTDITTKWFTKVYDGIIT